MQINNDVLEDKGRGISPFISTKAIFHDTHFQQICLLHTFSAHLYNGHNNYVIMWNVNNTVNYLVIMISFSLIHLTSKILSENRKTQMYQLTGWLKFE